MKTPKGHFEIYWPLVDQKRLTQLSYFQFSWLKTRKVIKCKKTLRSIKAPPNLSLIFWHIAEVHWTDFQTWIDSFYLSKCFSDNWQIFGTKPLNLGHKLFFLLYGCMTVRWKDRPFAQPNPIFKRSGKFEQFYIVFHLFYFIRS